MALLTNKESEILLKLFKDFSKDYNANSISKEIKISPRGALKILKKIEQNSLIKGRQLGRAVFYKVNLDDNYACKIIETLLIAEARENADRWLEEFKELSKDTEVIIIFGSIIRDTKESKDIDILTVFKKRKYKEVAKFIEGKNKILIKKIHNLPQTAGDLNKNLKDNKAIQDAIRTGYVLHGQNKLIKIIKNVTSL